MPANEASSPSIQNGAEIAALDISTTDKNPHVRRTRKQNPEKQDERERKILLILKMAAEKQFTNSGYNAIAAELAKRDVGLGYEAIRKILRGVDSLMITRNIRGIRKTSG